MVLVVLGATMSRRKRLDGLPVSMVLTSQAHRRRPPQKNRRIPTICAGRVDAGLVHVSAVDTGPRGSESAGSLVVEPGAAPSRSTPRGSGFTDYGLCVLHEGPTYPQYPQPSSSGPPPSCSASRRHRAATTVTGPAPSDRPKQQLSPPADPPRRCLEMPRHPKLPEVMRQHRG